MCNTCRLKQEWWAYGVIVALNYARSWAFFIAHVHALRRMRAVEGKIGQAGTMIFDLALFCSRPARSYGGSMAAGALEVSFTAHDRAVTMGMS